MIILLSKKMGFCLGVKKSIELANKTIKNKNTMIYMYGPIIHNPRIIKDYQKKGVKIINDFSKIPDGSTVITRAHGISPARCMEAKNRKINLIDTTCPNVKKLQKIATYLYEKQYFIIIYGDKNHPEISSVMEMVNHHALIVNQTAEIIDINQKKKIGIISQTTKNMHDFKKMASFLVDKTKELRIFNTICPATMERQESVYDLSKNVDVMVIIGGKNSANTSRLAEICKNQGVKTYHVEEKNQLKRDWFSKNDRVGIGSGASTPDYLTKEIIQQLKEWYL